MSISSKVIISFSHGDDGFGFQKNPQFWRTVLEDNVGGQCWRTVLEDNVGGQCWRTMLEDNVEGQYDLNHDLNRE